MKKIFFLALISLIVFGLVERGFAQRVLNQAYVHFLQEDYSKTIGECKRLLNDSAAQRYKDEIYYLMGLSYLKQRDFAGAQEYFNIVLSQYSKSEFYDDAYLGLGDTYLLEDNLDKAIEIYQKFVLFRRRSKLLHIAYYKLARCYQKKALWQEAKNYFSKLEKEFPDSLEAQQAKILKQECYFTAQVGSFINKGNAKALVDELNSKNFPAFISSIAKEGRSYYRVRVGKYKHRTTAKIIQDKLKNYGYPATVYP